MRLKQNTGLTLSIFSSKSSCLTMSIKYDRMCWSVNQLTTCSCLARPISFFFLFFFYLSVLLEQTLQVHGISLLQILLPPHYSQGSSQCEIPLSREAVKQGPDKPTVRYYWVNKDPVALGSSCNKIFYALIKKDKKVWHLKSINCFHFFGLFCCLICYHLSLSSNVVYCGATPLRRT